MTLYRCDNRDLEALLKLSYEPRYRYFFGDFLPKSVQDIVKLNDENVLLRAQDNDEYLGYVCLSDLDYRNRYLKYHLMLFEGLDSRGIGKGITREVCALVFDEMNFNKIIVEMVSSQQEAIAKTLSVGFAEEAILKQEHYYQGKYYDIVRMVKFKE